MRNRRSILLAGGALLAMNSLAGAATPPRKPAAAAPAPAKPAPKKDGPPTYSAETPLGPIDVMSKWAVIVDFATGATLLDKDADVSMPPSSMTKIMTAYVVYSMLKAGRLRLDQELPVSERAWKMGGSKMFVQVGTSVKVEDLIRGMIVQSGNDACIVLAEAIAGSEEAFAEQMNAKAREIGLLASNFRNATGWPDPQHRMTARDIALLARKLILDFPEYYHYDAEKSFKYNNIEQENRNPLVQKGIADGLKTGHTDEGGFGLVGSAQRGGRRVIIVVNGLPTMKARSEESERLLEWSYREFENVTLFANGATVDTVPVYLGEKPSVALVTNRELVMTVPRQWRKNAKVTVDFTSPVPAPVKAGTVLGKLTLSGQGVPAMVEPLVAGGDVGRLGMVQRSIAVMSRMVTKG